MLFDKCPECGNEELDYVYFGGILYEIECRHCSWIHSCAV